IADACRTAAELIAARDFARARKSLDEALRQFPEEPALLQTREELSSQQASWEKQRAVGEALEETRKLHSAGELDGALAHLTGALARLGSEGALTELLGSLEAERKNRDEFRQFLNAAMRESQRAELTGAFENIQAALRIKPEDSEAQVVRQGIQARLDQRE